MRHSTSWPDRPPRHPGLKLCPVGPLLILGLFSSALLGSDGSLFTADMLGADPNRCGLFAECTSHDLEGNIWVGTEDDGIAIYHDATHAWSRVGELPDRSAYALAFDWQGRAWVGHRTRGVSVLVDATWVTYGSGSGPIGERVYDIEICPSDGEVWIATNYGISRYLPESDAWSYITKADGLPSNDIARIAFLPNGNAIIGSQCDGIAIGTRKSKYQDWQSMKAGGHRFDDSGAGLAGNLVNDLLVTTNGRIFVATDSGISWSKDGGASWIFLRGRDTLQKSMETATAVPVPSDAKTPLLSEEYTTALAEGYDGDVLAGHREAAPEVLGFQADGKPDPKRSFVLANACFCKSICVSPGSAAFAVYGSGIIAVPMHGSSFPARQMRKSKMDHAGIPSKNRQFVPREEFTRKAEARHLLNKSSCYLLEDDWMTRGDWLGRYGRSWACLCAMDPTPGDLIWGFESGKIAYHATVGGHTTEQQVPTGYVPETFDMKEFKKDHLRYWIHWRETSNVNSLELPKPLRLNGASPGHEIARRQSEWDDHGETYSMNFDGPNIVADVSVPTGNHVLSLYFFNKDGHNDANRYRDFLVRVSDKSLRAGTSSAASTSDEDSSPHCRVNDFWGGVYKKFLIQGPRDVRVEVLRNYGFCTIVSGLFLDRCEDVPAPYLTLISHVKNLADDATGPLREESASIDALLASRPSLWALGHRYFNADLSAHTPSAVGQCLAHIQRELNRFSDQEDTFHLLGLHTCRDIELSFPCPEHVDASGKEAAFFGSLSDSDIIQHK